MLTPGQIQQILDIVKDHMAAATYLLTGVEPTDADIQAMRAEGLIDSSVPDSVLKDAFVYGMLLQMTPELASAPFADVLTAARAKPLSGLEQKVSEWLANSAAIHCAGLGNRVLAGASLIVNDLVKEGLVREQIKETLAAESEKRSTRSEMVSRLREVTEDAHRDWHRIVNTELHAAQTEGVATRLREKAGKDATVIVRPNPDACPVCKAAYLSGGVPKVFKLADLELSNIGRKRDDLIARPGKPPLHPFCHCQLLYFDPDTMEVGKNGQVRLKS